MVKQRWIIAVLAVSLSINLLFAGAVLGRWLKRNTDHPAPMAWATKTLDAGTRERLRPLLQQNREEARQLRRRLRTAADDVRSAIRSEPFDEQALSDALTRLREVSADYQQTVHTVALQALQELSVQERVRFGAMLLRPAPPEGPRHDRR